MNKQQLASKIWESANKMRSKIEANEYKDYILGFIFYKFLSENELMRLKDTDFTEDELLVCGSIHIGESEFRDELAEPGLRKSIFAHGHVSDGAFLVRFHPLGVVVAEQRF